MGPIAAHKSGRRRDNDSGQCRVRSSRGGRQTTKLLQIMAVCLVALAVLSLGVVVSGCSNGSAASNGQTMVLSGAGATNTVTVSGSATVTSPPDEAVIVLTVENDGATAQAAMDATSTQSNDLLAKLKAAGIEDSAIQTSSITLYPVRNYDPATGKESLAGYRADNSVKITLKDAPTVAKVLAVGVDAGIKLVSGPDWRLKDDSKAATEALKQAVAHARAKAESLAAAAGVSIGDVVSVNEQAIQMPTPIYAASGGAQADAVKAVEPAVSAGTLDVTASVTVTYTLKH